MPLIYYDTTAPTAGNKNSITRTALDFGIRDFLLHLNIQNPIRYPQYSTSINGSPRGGEPFLDTMVGNGSVPQQNPLVIDGVFRYDNAIIMNLYKNQDSAAPEFLDINYTLTTPIYPVPPNGTTQYPTTPDSTTAQYGLLAKSDFAEYRKQATIKNLYLDATKQVDMADYISLQPIQTAQQLPSYDEAYGQLLGVGKDATQAADILGSLLNGQGVGIAGGIGGAGGINVVPNFDLRSSLAGRVLGVAGVLNDTKLGTIGAQQLALALANNAAFNTEQAILGKLNLNENLLNLVQGDIGSIGLRPDYKITVSSTLGGQLLGLGEKILGFQVPKSLLQPEGSIFAEENKYVDNIVRANSMLKNTGKGQKEALKYNINANGENIQGPFRSGYVPGFEGVKNIKGYAFMNPQGVLTQNFLIPTDGIIPDLNWNREKLVADSGFIGLPSASDSKPFAQNFAWTSNKGATTNLLAQQAEFVGPAAPQSSNAQFVGEKKSLLSKTQMLFNSKGMRTMVSAYGSAEGGNSKEQIQTAISPNGFISKGSGVLSKFRFNPDGTLGNSSSNDSATNTFCRTWIPQYRYDTVNKLIRSRGLNQKEGSGGPILTGGTKGWRLHNSERMSVLDDNGFAKIAPYKTDDLTRRSTIPKKYMFSIENLAWVGSPAVNLLPIEQGPGDLLTGKFGRIMWFPPYDLTFSESSSVSLESNLFIGRGEPLYTYNNTERTGNLSFKIVVDHPSSMNGFKGDNGPTDEYIRSWFAGCIDDDYYASLLTREEQETVKQTVKTYVDEITEPPVEAPSEITIYFPNDITKIETVLAWNYEDGGLTGHGKYNGEKQYKDATDTEGYDSPNPKLDYYATIPPPTGYTGYWPDSTNYGFNKPGTSKSLGNKKLKVPPDKEFDTWNDEAYKTALRDYLKNTCPSCVAEIEGYASSQGGGQTYANEQLSKNRAAAMEKWLLDNNIIEKKRIVGTVKTATKDGQKFPYTSKTPVDSQGPKYDRYGRVKFTNKAEGTKTKKPRTVVEPEQIALNSQVTNRFYTEQDFFEKLTRDDSFVFDKIRQQIRYFHPAFHSTTPEGLNSRLTFLLQCTRQGPTSNANDNPNNLAFGPAPVCILRIGDFYNTKIMMDNLSIDYEPLVWDLNPEGVGVQPMIANVTISFKYIGGSSMYGPINKLQNALSFNYFANSQVYDPRADYIATVEDIKLLDKNYKGGNTRTTFASKTELMPEGTQETAYGLVLGLDSVTTSMGAFGDTVPTYAPPTVDQTATSDEDKKQTSSDTQGGDGTSSSCERDKDNLYWFNVQDEKNEPISFFEDIIGFRFDYNDSAVKILQPYDSYINVYDINDLSVIYVATNPNKLFYAEDNKTYAPENNNFYCTPTDNGIWGDNPPPQSLIDSGEYNVSIQLVGVNDPTCEIIFDTATGIVTKSETKCDSDGQIISIGVSESDTSNPDLKVLKDATKGNYISFFINATDKTVELSQDYKLTVTLISKINEKDTYVWKTPIDVSSAFTKSNSVVNNLYFSNTEPKTPELIEGNEIPYKIVFSFAGVSIPCSYDIDVNGLTNSQQEQESAIKNLTVKDVTTTNTNNKNGVISFNLYNNGDPTRPELSQYKLNVKSTIKSADGLEQYQYIHLDTSDSTQLLQFDPFSFKKNTKDNALSIPLANVTPPCTGLTEGKQYSLETLVYNDTTKVQLNTEMLTNTANTNVSKPGITIDYLGEFSTLQGNDASYFNLEQTTGKYLVLRIIDPNYDFMKVGNTQFKDDSGKIVSNVCLGANAQSCIVNDKKDGTYTLNVDYYPDGATNPNKLNLVSQPFTQPTTPSSVTPAPAPPTPVAASNSKDADVVNAINIKKVYPYDKSLNSITVDFEWGRTDKLPTFALQSSKTYKGMVTIKANINGASLNLGLGVDGTFNVSRNDDTSVVFDSGSDSSSQVIVANTEVAADQPSGKAWEKGTTWQGVLDLGDIDEDNKNNILAAQKDPSSRFIINWETGGQPGISFYLDNTPAPPPTSTPTSPYQLPYALKDSYDVTTFNFGNNRDKLHAFQSTTINGVSRNVGEMNTKVAKVLYALYDAGINPTVISVEVTVKGPVVTWTATIDRSTDGKAWVGFSSRGSATSLAVANENYDGNPNTNPPTVGLLENIKKNFPSDASSVELVALGDFINLSSKIGTETCTFWQKFAKYTLPVTKPPK